MTRTEDAAIERHEYVGPPKPFCPCDTGRPQDCKPERWPGAHTMPPCQECGAPIYLSTHIRPHTDDRQPDRVIR